MGRGWGVVAAVVAGMGAGVRDEILCIPYGMLDSGRLRGRFVWCPGQRYSVFWKFLSKKGCETKFHYSLRYNGFWAPSGPSHLRCPDRRYCRLWHFFDFFLKKRFETKCRHSQRYIEFWGPSAPSHFGTPHGRQSRD